MEGKNAPYIKHLGKAYNSFAPLVASQLWLLEATWRRYTWPSQNFVSWFGYICLSCVCLPKKTHISLEHMLVGRQKNSFSLTHWKGDICSCVFFLGGGSERWGSGICCDWLPSKVGPLVFFFYPVFQHGQTVEAISSVHQVCETKNSNVVDEGFEENPRK